MAGEANSKRIRFLSWKMPQRGDQARELIKIMLQMGSPIVYQGGAISRLKYDELGIRAQPMNKDDLLAEINLTTDYMVQKTEKAVDPNGNVITNDDGEPIRRIVAVVGDVHYHAINTAFGLPWPQNGLWKLRGVLTHPIINREGKYVVRNGLSWHDAEINGMLMKNAAPEINLADGYDPVSRYFFAVPAAVLAGLEGIESQKPTNADLQAAIDCIEDFLCDFNFATLSARASAIAFMLTLLCRELIDGPVPMLEVRAPESQSGKSLLVKMMLRAITGEMPSIFAPHFKDVSEFEKELLSQLLRGKNYIFMDNVYWKVQSSFMDMALTTGYADKRLLGANQMATVYCGMPFVMTANNPTLSDDMKNRVYLLDINKPKEGTEFVHGQPETYAQERGPQLLKALFTLYNHWDKNEGRRPFKEKRIDGFIAWSAIIGGMLQAAGHKGFLDDTIRQIREADPKLEQAADMARRWHEARGSEWLRVKDTLDYSIGAGYGDKDDSCMKRIQDTASNLKKLRMKKLPGGYRFEKNLDETRESLWRVAKDDN